MTDDEKLALNREIAEMREPQPTCSKWKWMHDQDWNLSDGKSWAGFRDDPTDDNEPIEWHPRNFCGSEDASAELLEEMPIGFGIEREVNSWCVVWPYKTNDDDLRRDWRIDPDRKIAIALAYRAWRRTLLP